MLLQVPLSMMQQLQLLVLLQLQLYFFVDAVENIAAFAAVTDSSVAEVAVIKYSKQ